MRVLLVEDDKELSSLVEKLLTDENYVVDTAFDGEVGEEKALANEYDAIILDLTLPKKDGLEVCKSLRAEGAKTPILMLTGRATISEKVTGLDSGADDYLVKPFGAKELYARLRAVMRRPAKVLPKELVVGPLELDPSTHEVKRDGQLIDLMPKEYSLLEFLMRNPGQVCTREELLNHVWGVYSNNSSNRLEVYIRYLRNKVDLDFDEDLIKTVRGTGYKIVDGE